MDSYSLNTGRFCAQMRPRIASDRLHEKFE